MARRPVGGVVTSSVSDAGAPCELSGSPLLVATSSRPPTDAAGGQEEDPLSPHEPWIQALRRGRMDAEGGPAVGPSFASSLRPRTLLVRILAV